MADLTTLAAVKAYLAITSTGQDALIPALITRESAAVENWTGRSFSPVTYTLRALNGTGTSMLMLPDTPIQSISFLSIEGVTVLPAASAQGVGYLIDGTTIYLASGARFPMGRQNVLCSWVAGYAAVPGPVEQAVIEMVGMDLKSRDNLGITSKTLANETISYSDRGMSRSVIEMLQPYRKVSPC